MDDIRAGVYRHYKNKLYLVLGLAHDANADTLCVERSSTQNVWHEPLGERTVVVYIGLQLDDAHTGPRLAVRGYDDFFAYVHMGNPDRFTEGTVCEGSCAYRRLNSDEWGTHSIVPRFAYVGPTWEGQ